MSNILFDSLHQGLGKVLDLRQAQHALTASNLANADTPGYHARFIPFDEVLADAVGESDAMHLRRTDPRHVTADALDGGAPPVEEVEPQPWSIDGNSVSSEREAVRLTENALMYEAVSRGTSRRLALLRFAASDGKTA